MWLNAIEWKDKENQKVFSETELLILATVPNDHFSQSTEIIDDLRRKTLEWIPKSGTVYPILNRFAELGLLQKDDSSRSSYQRSDAGDAVLSSILKPLKVQIAESFNYYGTILEMIVPLLPFDSVIYQTLKEIEGMNNRFESRLKIIARDVKKREIESEAYDVPIKFE